MTAFRININKFAFADCFFTKVNTLLEHIDDSHIDD